MTVALASLFTAGAVDARTAMTGEMTLTGLVLPVGGIKEKVLAARRAGIRKIILPKANDHDLQKLSDEVRGALDIVLVEHIDQALQAAIPSLNGGHESTRQRSSEIAAASSTRASQVVSKARSRSEM